MQAGVGSSARRRPCLVRRSEEVVVTDRRAPPPARPDPVSSAGDGSVVEIQMADRYARVLRLIDFFRARGHRIAKSDPLGEESTYFPELDPGHYGLGDEDMSPANSSRETFRGERFRR